jgi:hypothetical protein
MSRSVFVCRSHVEHGDGTLREPRGQIGAADGFGGVPASRQTARDALDLRQVPRGDNAQKIRQFRCLRVGLPADHRLAVAAAGDQCRTAQVLQVP